MPLIKAARDRVRGRRAAASLPGRRFSSPSNLYSHLPRRSSLPLLPCLDQGQARINDRGIPSADKVADDNPRR